MFYYMHQLAPPGPIFLLWNLYTEKQKMQKKTSIGYTETE